MSGDVLFAGEKGAFGEEFCRTYLAERTPLGVASFAAVVEGVTQGRAECGVVPTRNSRAGPVDGVSELLENAAIRTVDHQWLAVRMHCLAVPSATLDDIAEVRSHPMALRQSFDFLNRHCWNRVEVGDTALAARQVAEEGNRRIAAFASRAAAQAYGLSILAENVHDDAANRTEFAIIVRRDSAAA